MNFEKENTGWRKSWQEGRTGWDLMGPHRLMPTVLERLRVEAGVQEKAKVFVPGCGRAHDAAFFAKEAFITKASDLSYDAIEAAKSLYKDQVGLTLAVEDVMTVSENEQFDIVFDRAMLCAMRPHQRKPYLDQVHSMLKPGAVFVGILFESVSIDENDGPPFALTQEMQRAMFLENYELVCWEHYRNQEPPKAILTEDLVIWRKKEKKAQ